MFIDIPTQFADGALFSAGWKAAGAGKFLPGVINNAYSRIAPRIISNFKPITTLAKYYPEDGGALGKWTTKH